MPTDGTLNRSFFVVDRSDSLSKGKFGPVFKAASQLAILKSDELGARRLLAKREKTRKQKINAFRALLPSDAKTIGDQASR